MWNKILGQKKQINFLKEVFRNKKIPHAYLFYGPDGVGKEAVAVEFGKLLNCENPVDAQACDNCKSCKQFAEFNSPYLTFVVPLPPVKTEENTDSSRTAKKQDPIYEHLRQELQKKAKDLYYKINVEKSNNILIDSIRKIKNDVYLSSGHGKVKVFIISNCDKMNSSSANAFLKILEEPPKNSLFILTTSKVNSLFPTIVGRCQKIRFDGIDNTGIRKYIETTNPGINKNDADFIVKLSDGSVSRCNDIMNNDIPEIREAVLNSLFYLLRNNTITLGKLINSFTTSKDKDKIRTFLMLLTIWFRDQIHIKSGNKNGIYFSDITDRLEKFSDNFSFNSYRIIKMIEDSTSDLDKNINPELLLFRLFYSIKFELKKNVRS